MKPAVVLVLGGAFLSLLALLPSAEAAPQLAGMSTLTKPKKPARRALAAPLSPSARLAARVRAGKFAPGADFKTIAAVADSRSSSRLR